MHLYQQVLAGCPMKQNSVIYHAGRCYATESILINKPDKLLSKCVTRTTASESHFASCVVLQIYEGKSISNFCCCSTVHFDKYQSFF
jgi:hypothetical protein